MSLRPGKVLPLLLLVPIVLYGAAKGILYYKAKQTVDDIVTVAANHADIRYADISTDLRGAVTVSGITVQPRGSRDAAAVEMVRIASDDPMFFFRGAAWQPGENAPPPSLSLMVNGLKVPLSADFVDEATAAAPEKGLCEGGLQIDAALLKRLGFTELGIDIDAHYRLDEATRTLEVAMNMDMREIESMRFRATLTDVDVETLSRGGAPQVSLGDFTMAMNVAPEFGRNALKACAAGSEETVQAWSERLAELALAEFKQQGLVLGNGLSNAVRAFYRDWGEVKLVAAPEKPVGMLSLVFLPPDQLAGALGLELSVNDRPVLDTSFSWQGPASQDLSSLFGADESQTAAPDKNAPRRVIVRRDYEPVAVRDIRRYVNHQVHIKPRGQPLREGVLKRINDGEAEVEQSLHGGKFTVYVPLEDIESLQALVQREIAPLR